MELVINLASFVIGVLVAYIILRMQETKLRDRLKAKYNLHSSEEVREALYNAEVMSKEIQEYTRVNYTLTFNDRVLVFLNNSEKFK